MWKTSAGLISAALIAALISAGSLDTYNNNNNNNNNIY
jgi:hypothetical protein